MAVRYLSITLDVEVECTPETTLDEAGTIVDAIAREIRSDLNRNIVTVDVHDWDLSKVFDR
jgi:divalent metal cation (Fe/Co/Zn/Cd) transporter